ncbi:C25 family cysteine peptidase [Bacteroidota bacterium]
MKLNFAILLTLCCLFVFPQTEAQQSRQIELSASMDQFVLDEGKDGFTRIIPHKRAYHYPQGNNMPALPLIEISVLVPPGAELENYSFRCERELVKENVNLARAPVPIPSSGMIESKTGHQEFDGSYAYEAVSYVSTMIQRGYTWFSFNYSPFEYDGNSGKLTFVRKVILDLEYKVSPKGIQILRPDPVLAGYLKEKFVNPHDLSRFYPEDQEYGLKLKSSPDRVDYLIVTTEEFKQAFQPLLDWKTRKGLKSNLVTVEEIEETYDHPNIQLKIKHYLYDNYLDHGLKWVLMGGDADVVPVQGCYSIVDMTESVIEEWSIPTDLFYACFDGRLDWNSVEDEKIGQVHWDVYDLNPEVYISRLPLNTPTQVEDFVRKTIRYETDPPLEDFFDRMLLTGVKFLRRWDGYSDSHHRSEKFYDTYLKDKWRGKKIKFYDTGSDFPSGAGYDVTSRNLSTQLNSGFGFFHFCGHGNTHYLVMEQGIEFNTTDVLGLENTAPGIIMANSCHVNAFDSIDPCLSEAFLRNPVGGGIAFFGSSRFGFDNPMESDDLGPSMVYNASFARYLFRKSNPEEWKTFAEVAARAKSDLIASGSSGGANAYLQYAINPMGDPELPLYSADPLIFDHVRIYRFGNDLTVNTGGIENCRICLTSRDLKEGYQQLTENIAFHTFYEIPESFQVTITAPGYRPFIYNSSQVTSVDNEHHAMVSVYPNPARDFIMIDLIEPEARVRLCDLNGRVLEDLYIDGGSFRLELSQFPDGIYFLNISTGSGLESFKVIKQLNSDSRYF